MVFHNLSWNPNGFLQYNQSSNHLLLLTTQHFSKKCLQGQTLLPRKHGCDNTIMKSWHKQQSNHSLVKSETAQVMQGSSLQSMEIHKESLFHVELLQGIQILMQEQWLLQPSTKLYEMQYVLVSILTKWLALITSVGQIQLNPKRLLMANSNLHNLFERIEN